MKYEDIVAGLSENVVHAHATPQLHAPKGVSREDWVAYMARPLQALWDMVKYESQGIMLEKATYADWEEFCWNLTKIRTQASYSQWLCDLDFKKD